MSRFGVVIPSPPFGGHVFACKSNVLVVAGLIFLTRFPRLSQLESSQTETTAAHLFIVHVGEEPAANERRFVFTPSLRSHVCFVFSDRLLKLHVNFLKCVLHKNNRAGLLLNRCSSAERSREHAARKKVGRSAARGDNDGGQTDDSRLLSDVSHYKVTFTCKARAATRARLANVISVGRQISRDDL